MQDILWQGTGRRNMTEIFGTHNLAKGAANFMACIWLFRELEGHVYLTLRKVPPNRRKPRRWTWNIGLSSMAKVDIHSIQFHPQTLVTSEMAE